MQPQEDECGFDFHPLQEALRLSAEEASRRNVNAVIAVMNATGLLSGFLRMPGSFLASNDYAQWKAWTAASFSMSSRDFGKLLDGMEEHIRDGLLAHQNATVLPGGFPIHKNDKLIGAIGVSGGNAEEDEAIALAGLKAFED